MHQTRITPHSFALCNSSNTVCSRPSAASPAQSRTYVISWKNGKMVPRLVPCPLSLLLFSFCFLPRESNYIKTREREREMELSRSDRGSLPSLLFAEMKKESLEGLFSYPGFLLLLELSKGKGKDVK